MAAGQPASEFDDQTPLTHGAIMKGAFERDRMEIEAAVAAAWHGVNLSRTDPKRFPQLKSYLAKLRPQPQATPQEIVAAFKRLAEAGLDVKVT